MIKCHLPKRVCDQQRFLTIFLLLSILSFFCLTIPVEAKNAIIDFRVGKTEVEEQLGVRIVLESRSPPQASLSLLKSPYRLVIDMPSMEWNAKGLEKVGVIDVFPASRYRFGSPRAGIGRLVIELERPAAPYRFFNLSSKNGSHRLVVDLIDRGETAFIVAKAALDKKRGFSPRADTVESKKFQENRQLDSSPIAPIDEVQQKPEPKNFFITTPTIDMIIPKSKPKRWVVFIDAGHGGKDPGAVSREGTYEKSITLAAAKELALQLRATGKVIPILSRKDDRYLRLRERINLGRKKKADVFISLHADSAHSRTARGISVFTLSDRASDKEAAALAKKENKADLIGGPDLSIEDPDAAGALVRMFQRESMNQSAYLAKAILKHIKDLPGGDKRGHRFAGFAVLKAPDIPSVLVEMGFISNQQDEKNLRKKAYRKDLSQRLTRAVLSYLSEYGPKLE